MAVPSHRVLRMTRRHDIDALRVLAFGLLIFYHAGMLYVAPVADWQGMPLHSHYLATWLQYPMLFVIEVG